MTTFSILTRDHQAHTILAPGKLKAVHTLCCNFHYHETDILMVTNVSQNHQNHQAKDV